jgi:ribose/xylose/arabinose/galactoside ABC-type transport system permease subunit
MSTSTITPQAAPPRRPLRIPKAYLPVLSTLVLLVAMFSAAAARYEGLASGQVVLNILIDNAFLLVVAVGMTFVIQTGGIDLSVGAVVALSTMISATLVAQHGWTPLVAIPAVLAVGAALGLVMGCIIHFFEIQPFIVTLAGMFLARGLCYTISTDSIPISDPFYVTMATTAIPLSSNTSVTTSVLIAVAVVLIAVYVLHYTRTGYLFGSVLGVLVLGLTQTIISFQGTLSSWWTRIVIAALLFVFIVLQRLVFARRT